MEKVKMTQEQFDAIQHRKQKGSNIEIIFSILKDPDDEFIHGSACINSMSEEQVAAAYYFPELCEIEPEYEELSNTEAALAWAQKRIIEFKSQDGHWYEFTKVHDPRMFQDKLRPFRVQKS